MKLDNFKLYELVSKQVYGLIGDSAWKLLDEDFLLDVDKLVSDLKQDTECSSVVVNDWYWGRSYNQSGFREASSTVGGSRSQHRLGKAVDLKFVGITIEEALNYLLANKDKYPAIRRYENTNYTVSSNKYGGWLHLDGKGTGKLRGFNP